MSATYIRCTTQRQFSQESEGILLHGSMPQDADMLRQRFGGKMQMIYLDPPFATGKKFDMKVRVGDEGWRRGTPTMLLPAYDDRWDSREEYLALMRDVLRLSYDLLKKDGTIFLHIDSRMHAHMRLLMDEIFGESNFLNEIVWSYQSGGRAKNYFPRKHDIILLYAKSKSYYFNIKGVPVARAETRSNHMRRGVDEDGRSYRAIMSAGKEYRYYDDEPAYPGDVWDDISHLQQKDPQRTGYETQKPIKLLERIIKCSTREGDWVCDLFAGSGTTGVAAAGLGRKFLCVDRSALAVAVAQKRLSQATGFLEQAGYEIEAPCGDDDCTVEAEVFPAISSYTMRLIRFESEKSKAAGLSGLDAVEMWSAGFVQGDVFSCCMTSTRTHGQPNLSNFVEMPVCAGEPCIMIVDIWGDRRFYLPRRRY